MTFDELENKWLSPKGPVTSIMDTGERRRIWDAIRENPGAPVIEVGCALGGTTALMVHAGAQPVYAVDNWQCGRRDEYLENIKLLKADHGIVDVPIASLDAAPQFQDGAYWVVLVDGNHEAPWPAKDIAAYAPKVMPGGYLFVDDTGNGHPAITQAVFEFERRSTSDFVHVFRHTQDTGQAKMVGFRRKMGGK